MSIYGRMMIANTQLAAAVASLYTVGESTRAQVQAMTLTNTTGVAATVTIYLVPSGGTATAPTAILSAKSMAAGESYKVIEAIGQWLEAGAAIYAVASVAATISITASGIEVR